jgi:hypothetical protein
VTILDGSFVSTSEAKFRNGMNSKKAHVLRQLNGRELLVVVNSAVSEGLKFHIQV